MIWPKRKSGLFFAALLQVGVGLLDGYAVSKKKKTVSRRPAEKLGRYLSRHVRERRARLLEIPNARYDERSAQKRKGKNPDDQQGKGGRCRKEMVYSSRSISTSRGYTFARLVRHTEGTSQCSMVVGLSRFVSPSQAPDSTRDITYPRASRLLHLDRIPLVIQAIFILAWARRYSVQL